MANLGDATKITSGIALNTLVNETLEFVRKQLPGWRTTPSVRKRCPRKNLTVTYATT